MATWTFDRPAGTFSAQPDVNLATETYALANTPADFAASISAVDIAVETNAVDVAPGGQNDNYGLNVRIMSGATVLAAASAGGAYETVQAVADSSTYPKDFISLGFTYVLTTASKAQWDAAVIEYQQTYTKDQGADNDYITVAVGTNDITVTYTALAAPTLTLPTETNRTGQTATVGCTTDSASGTLYWFVSTSATAPSAANLKAGTGSVDFGNVVSPGIGTETFSVTGLSESSTYYTYFIHNNTVGDSNILESGSWTTAADLAADITADAAVTAAITTQIIFASDITADAATTGAITTQITFAASVVGSAVVTGNFQQGVDEFAAGVTGTATVTADLVFAFRFMSKGDYLENAWIDHIFRSSTFSKPAGIYIGLFTDDNGKEATVGTEVSGNGYTRSPNVQGDANWDTVGVDGITENLATITFPNATGSWGTVTHYGIFDAVSGGNLLYWGSLVSTEAVSGGQTVTIDIGDITITEF